MKNFIKEYLNIIAYSVTGLILVIASFYLVMNYYHSEEVKTTVYVSENDVNYQGYKDKLEKIKTNLDTFSKSKVTDNKLRAIYNKLSTCSLVLNGNNTLATIETEHYFTSKEVYELGSRFQTDVLNICFALHLSYITEENTDPRFKVVAPYVKNSVNTIASQVNFALSEIQNNSSYFYTTNITSSTIRNYLASDFTAIAKAYNDFASIILSLSEQLNTYSNGGNND